MHHQVEVLLVEGDQALRAEMAAYLTGHGFTVLEAGDAATARGLLKTRAIAVPVLDLPDEDGAALWREFAGAEGPAILMLSALATAVVPLGGRHQQAAKPIAATDLLAHIKAMTRRRGSRRA